MKAICASVNLDLFMVLPRPTARIAHAAKLEFSSKDRSENREAGHPPTPPGVLPGAKPGATPLFLSRKILSGNILDLFPPKNIPRGLFLLLSPRTKPHSAGISSISRSDQLGPPRARRKGCRPNEIEPAKNNFPGEFSE